MFRNKRKGFTIIEMLVSMLIASLLLGLAWNVYFFASHYQRQIEGKALAVNSRKKLEYLLTKDFFGCRHVHFADNRLEFVFESDTVRYLVDSASVIRAAAGIRDSLVLRVVVVSVDNNNPSLELCLFHGGDQTNCLALSREWASADLFNDGPEEKGNNESN